MLSCIAKVCRIVCLHGLAPSLSISSPASYAAKVCRVVGQSARRLLSQAWTGEWFLTIAALRGNWPLIEAQSLYRFCCMEFGVRLMTPEL
jgi:hypothetical protein